MQFSSGMGNKEEKGARGLQKNAKIKETLVVCRIENRYTKKIIRELGLLDLS